MGACLQPFWMSPLRGQYVQSLFSRNTFRFFLTLGHKQPPRASGCYCTTHSKVSCTNYGRSGSSSSSAASYCTLSKSFPVRGYQDPHRRNERPKGHRIWSYRRPDRENTRRSISDLCTTPLRKAFAFHTAAQGNGRASTWIILQTWRQCRTGVAFQRPRFESRTLEVSIRSFIILIYTVIELKYLPYTYVHLDNVNHVITQCSSGSSRLWNYCRGSANSWYIDKCPGSW